MSMPFFNKQFTFTQPDGSQIEVVGSGNQHYAHFETIDGYTVIENPVTGFYEFAVPTLDNQELRPSGVAVNELQPAGPKCLRPTRAAVRSLSRESNLASGGNRWEERRRQNKQQLVDSLRGVAPAPPSRQTVGTYKGLCILIDFQDAPGTIAPAEVEKFCNTNGYSGFGNNGSVRDYFLDVSGGKVDYSNVVTSTYYRAQHPRTYYTDESVNQPIRARELIREALTFLKANGSVNFSDLTVDDGGYVYALNVFYAGSRVNNWAKGLWPHQHYLASPFDLGGGRKVSDYQITNMGNELSLGTFCHENGHMLCDFPDLYDYGPESRGVGVFCLMCAGGAYSEKNPGHIGAYLKHAAGWGEAAALDPGQHSLEPNKNRFLIHRHPTNSAEYFIVENRAATGRDRVLPGSGLAIWHIDEFGNNSNEQMTPASHYECSLVQADGRHEMEKGVNNGDKTDLFPTAANAALSDATAPNSKWWNGLASGLVLQNIERTGDAVKFTVG